MRVLRQLHEGLGDSVQLHLFGCVETDPDFLRLERGFPHTNHGPLTRQKVAELLGACHVFLDASDYQAFGRTALEAMACRCASVVPAAGGAREYAVHEENALVVDTTSEEEILRQMTTLLQSRATIDTLAEAGQKTASRYSTEESAISIAKTLGLLA
jgi:glycosyltransferase involved in cell wall biosynthesis